MARTVRRGKGLSRIGGQILQNQAISTAQTLLFPWTRTLQYESNNTIPNCIPDANEIIDAYQRRWVDWPTAWKFLRWHGINGNNTADEDRKKIWDSVFNAGIYVPSIEDLLSLHKMHVYQSEVNRRFENNRHRLSTSDTGMTKQQYREWVKHHKLTSEFLATAVENQTEGLSIEDANNLWRQLAIPVQVWRAALSLHGITDHYSQDMQLKVSNPSSPLDTLTMYWRGLFTRPAMEQELERSGLVSPVDKWVFETANTLTPTPSDLVRFAVREVWDDRTAERFGYDSEFDDIPQFRKWMQALGYVGSPVPPQELTAADRQTIRDRDLTRFDTAAERRGRLTSWAQAFWREHWSVMSPTQGYEAFHLFRPNRMHRYNERIPGIAPFGIDDLQTLLKVADYPVPMRKWLAGLSFRPMRLVDIYRLYEDKIIDSNEVYELFLDRGYSPVDARAVQQWLTSKRDNEEFRRQQKQARAEVVDAYRVGFIDRDSAAQRLDKLGLRLRTANATLANVDSKLAKDNVKAAIAAIARQYMNWDVNESQAKEKLRTLGIVPQRVDYYVQSWTYGRESKGKRASASTISRWVVRGIMSGEDAIKRLVAMGYDDVDARRVVQVARLDHGLLIARQRRAEALTEKERKRAMEQEIRELEKVRKRMSARLIKSGTPGNLKRWLKFGLISANEVAVRLRVLDWHPADINRFIEEVTGKPFNASS